MEIRKQRHKKNIKTRGKRRNQDPKAEACTNMPPPTKKSPSGCSGLTGRDQNDLTLVPWQSGKSLCWDVTVSCPLAESYVTEAARMAGVVAELAATRKELKYAVIVGRHNV